MVVWSGGWFVMGARNSWRLAGVGVQGRRGPIPGGLTTASLLWTSLNTYPDHPPLDTEASTPTHVGQKRPKAVICRFKRRQWLFPGLGRLPMADNGSASSALQDPEIPPSLEREKWFLAIRPLNVQQGCRVYLSGDVGGMAGFCSMQNRHFHHPWWSDSAIKPTWTYLRRPQIGIPGNLAGHQASNNHSNKDHQTIRLAHKAD